MNSASYQLEWEAKGAEGCEQLRAMLAHANDAVKTLRGRSFIIDGQGTKATFRLVKTAEAEARRA
ncbi:MAG: hypothetical protein WA117_11685 [Verrucomicrobiia bacterium]